VPVGEVSEGHSQQGGNSLGCQRSDITHVPQEIEGPNIDDESKSADDTELCEFMDEVLEPVIQSPHV